MITELGIVAGDIWHCLDKKGEWFLSRLVNALDKERDIILMSLGWLAREGHVTVSREEEDYKVILRRT